MLLKGMDREQAQLFLQQSIAQMCKVTVSFTGPIEIDGIICITGRDKDDLVLVKLHEKLTSAALPGFDVSSCETEDALNADNQEKHTSDICTSIDTLAPDECEQETLKSEDSRESVQTKPYDSDVNELDSQTYKTETLPSTSGIFDTTALAGDVKAEPILLDSDYEDCVDLSDSPYESESGSSTDALHCIKRAMCAGVDPNEPSAKLMNLGLQNEYVVSPQVDSVAVRSSRLTPDGTEPLPSDGSLSCSLCAEAFSAFVSLRQHMSSAHGQHVCEQCLQLFQNPVLLQQHRKLHGVTGRGSVHWLCTLCRRSFRRKEHLCHHISCHQNMQLHQCGQCSKGFTARSMLQLHLSRQHGGRTEYVCRPCFMAFADAETFAQHENHHKQCDVPYACPLCAFTADDRMALVKHGFVHFGLRVVTTAK